MKVELLLNDCNKQESLMSESVTVTRTNYKTLQGKPPDNMTHVSHTDTMTGNNSQCDQRARSGTTSPWCSLPHENLDGQSVGGSNTIPYNICEMR
jgi:hypothetical protein